jgi:hypothetical protein
MTDQVKEVSLSLREKGIQAEHAIRAMRFPGNGVVDIHVSDPANHLLLLHSHSIDLVQSHDSTLTCCFQLGKSQKSLLKVKAK